MRDKDQKLIWESLTPEFDSRERDKLAGVDKHMPVTDVQVHDEYTNLSDSELQDKLEAIQEEIERRSIVRRSRQASQGL